MLLLRKSGRTGHHPHSCPTPQRFPTSSRHCRLDIHSLKERVSVRPAELYPIRQKERFAVFFSQALLPLLLTVLPAAQADKPDSAALDAVSAATFSGLKLRSLGPAVTSGRIVGFAVHPTDRGHY